MISRRCSLFAAVLLAAALGAGCTIQTARIGNRLTAEDLQPLATVKNKHEILTQIGPPSSIELLPDGSAFVYRCAIGEGSQFRLSALEASYDSQESDSRAQLLRITFDKSGQVRDYGFSIRPFDEDGSKERSP